MSRLPAPETAHGQKFCSWHDEIILGQQRFTILQDLGRRDRERRQNVCTSMVERRQLRKKCCVRRVSATIDTSRREHARRLHLNCGSLPINMKYARGKNLDVVPGQVSSETSRWYLFQSTPITATTTAVTAGNVRLTAILPTRVDPSSIRVKP